MGTHPIFESDFDCLTEMNESEQNESGRDDDGTDQSDSSSATTDMDSDVELDRGGLEEIIRLVRGDMSGEIPTRTRRIAQETLLNILRQRSISANFEYINQFENENEPELENKTLTDQSALEFMHHLKTRLSHSTQSKSFIHKLRRRSTHIRRRSHMQHLGSQMVPEKFLGHLKLGRRVFCGVFSPDGRSFVTATQDHIIRIINVDKVDGSEEIFETEDGRREIIPLSRRGDQVIRKRLSIGAGGWSILDLALAPDSQTGVIGGWGEAIHLFYLDNERQDTTPIALPNIYGEHQVHSAIFSCSYSPDGKRIIGGSRNGILYQFDLERAESMCHIANRKEEDVNAICYSKENPNLVFSGGDDGILTCWDSRLFGSPDSPVGYLAGHSEGVTYIDTASDGYSLLTNSKDQTIKIWDVRNFSDENSAIQQQSRISDNRNRLDYRYDQPENWGFGRVIERKPHDSSVMTLAGHRVTTTLIRARFSPQYTGSRYVYSGDSNYGYCVWDLFTGQLIVKNDFFHRMNVRDCSWHPHRPLIATSSWDETVAFWEADTFKVDDSKMESDEDEDEQDS